MSDRVEKFTACKHKNVQQYTEVCLDCGENIHTTPNQIKREEAKAKEKKEEKWNENGW